MSDTELEELAKNKFAGITVNGFTCYGPENWQTICPFCGERLVMKSSRGIAAKYTAHLIKVHQRGLE